MWSLVYIFFIAGTPQVQFMGNYETMFNCFEDREILSQDVGGIEGHFPPGSQAVCIYRGDENV